MLAYGVPAADLFISNAVTSRAGKKLTEAKNASVADQHLSCFLSLQTQNSLLTNLRILLALLAFFQQLQAAGSRTSKEAGNMELLAFTSLVNKILAGSVSQEVAPEIRANLFTLAKINGGVRLNAVS